MSAFGGKADMGRRTVRIISPLLAQSGRAETICIVSGFGGEADFHDPRGGLRLSRSASAWIRSAVPKPSVN
jgi:hypothetical protein